MRDVLCKLMTCFSGLLLSFACAAAPIHATYMSGNRSVKYEVYGEVANAPVIILLHGASGPDAQLYRDQAEYFAGQGYTVLYLHYFDATGSSAPNDQNYLLWVGAVTDLVAKLRKDNGGSRLKIALVGFSLGASVALAAGSQGVAVDAIADWYGSLPDEFFAKFRGMPPLLVLHGKRDSVIPIVNAEQLLRLCGMEKLTCESHLYSDQDHGFKGQALSDAQKRTTEFFARRLK